MSLKELYGKVEAFQSKLSDGARNLSQCKKGCAQCCKVDLSVFSVEADAIRAWFQSLGLREKEELFSVWQEPPAGECVFLKDNSCTIYEARPLICRTQGLPLRFVEAGQAFLDVCPLNEDMLTVVGSGEIVNLDLLNLILAKLEQSHGDRSRIKLSDLRRSLT